MRLFIFTLKWSLIGLGAAVLIIGSLHYLGLGEDIRLVVGETPATDQTEHTLGYAAAVAKAAPAVISIHAVNRRAQSSNPITEDPIFRQFFGTPSSRNTTRAESSLGSGVILDESGILLTNYHVIRGAEAIQISLHDGRMATAEVVGIDPDTDLAVLRIKLDHLPHIIIADSNELKVGDVVLAIGNPLGIGQTVTQGIVSATGRNRVGINTFENFIQTDAAINFGNSGGALINASGALVGINSVRVDSEGIGFAIPTSIAVKVAKQILASGSVVRGWLGMEARNLTTRLQEMLGVNEGILVLAVLAGGPADVADIRPGDVITHIDEMPITDSRTATERIADLEPGSSVPVRAIRSQRAYTAEVVVSRRPPPRG